MSRVLTVVICTRNRAASLERTLQRLAAIAHPPPATWEVVVIDNGSTDHTQAVLQRFSGLLPLRAFVEPQSGLSVARNCAIRHATGTWIAWTDDDVLVGEQWLTTYHHELTSPSPPDIAGGPILPRFEAEPDDYVSEVVRQYPQVFALLDLGHRQGPFPPDRVPYGANMVIRRKLLDAGGFDPEFGLGGAVPMSGEDTILLEHLVAEGASTLWLPDASVEHVLAADRLTEAFVRNWAFIGGRTGVRESLRVTSTRRRFRIWIWLLVHALRTIILNRWRAPADAAHRVRYDFRLNAARGMVSELLRLQ